MGAVIYAGRVGRYLERKRIGGKGSKIQVSRRIFDKFKEGIWWRRRRVSKGGRTEEAGARRKDDGGVHARI